MKWLANSAISKVVAKIKIAGRLNAAVEGVATEIELDGNADFDLAKHCLTSIHLRIEGNSVDMSLPEWMSRPN